MNDTSSAVIGQHVSTLPHALEDVWPIVDGAGVVIELVQTWDDGQYVCLDRHGEPVDDVGRTHHIMARTVFQQVGLPDDWVFVGVRRIPHDTSRSARPQLAASPILGGRREYEFLKKLNSGAGLVIAEVDTMPPYTHVVQYRDEFFLVQARAGARVEVTGAPPPAPTAGEVAAGSSTAVPAKASVADAAPAGNTATSAPAPPAEAPAAPASAAPAPETREVTAALPAGLPDAETVAKWVAAMAAEEAAATATPAPEAAIIPKPPARPKKAEKKGKVELKAIAREIDDPDQRIDIVDTFKPGGGTVGLESSLDEGVWEAGGKSSPAAAQAGSAKDLLVSKMSGEEDVEAAREASFTQAKSFVASLASDIEHVGDGVLTLDQVKAADRFAWDEYMDLFLPKVGFVAVMPASDATNGEATGDLSDVSFVPRSDWTVRPVGWHHLAGCDCEFCGG